jgi:uncharacterized protein
MLIEFRVENHRSLRDEQVLTMEAASRVGDADDPRPRNVAGHEKALMPVTVLYGANASGKSNVLSALSFMRTAVRWSHREWDPEGGVPRTAFAWGQKKSEPSTFEATFLVNETRYEYGFSVSDQAIEEEWLYAWPNNRRQIWFEREGQNFAFGDHFEGPNELIKSVTRSNALFLSVGSQHKHELLSRVYWWFASIRALNVIGNHQHLHLSKHAYSRILSGQRFLFPEFDNDQVIVDRLRNLLKAADLGIVGIRFEKDATRAAEPDGVRIFLQHQSGNDNSWLPLEEESSGTQTLFRIATPVFTSLLGGTMLLIDELESSLHPLLGLAIIKLFNNPVSNPNNAQLLFTTHDTNLLGTSLGDPPLRRDQIWFTEKDDEGGSRLYPLTDYKPRKEENLERGYLQGRYGAIPFLGELAISKE